MASKLQNWAWVGAATLTFSAGMVNVIALLSFTHKAATHVTGVTSSLSIALSRLEYSGSAQAMCMLLSFFGGAFLSGAIIRDGHLKMGRRYGVALAIEACFLFLATYFFVNGIVLGEYLACLAAGLQNGLASAYSGTIVRTTHLTGIVTDLGVLMGNRARGIVIDARKFKLLTIILVSFIVGGLAGSVVYQLVGSWAMLLPSVIITLSAGGYELIRRYLSKSKRIFPST